MISEHWNKLINLLENEIYGDLMPQQCVIHVVQKNQQAVQNAKQESSSTVIAQTHVGSSLCAAQVLL